MPIFSNPNWLVNLIVLIPPLLLSLTLHEYAPARTALALGDPTAKLMGRVTLSPLAHLDPIGTICLLMSQMFGWAKPVPVNPMNLEPRRLGDIAVSLAGPVSNLGLALISALLMRLLFYEYAVIAPGFANPFFRMMRIMVAVNLGLFMFNLLPLFPLDGHHILREILPWRMQEKFMRWQLRFGVWVLMGLMFLPRLVSRATEGGVISPVGYVHRLLLDPLMAWIRSPGAPVQ